MTPSPITEIDAEEYAWLRGNLWYVERKRLVPLEPRAYDPAAVPELPIEEQTPCREPAVDALRLCAASVVICGVIVFWSVVVALVARVVG